MITAGIIGPLVHLLQTAEFDIKKEAAWAISNATSGGSHDQIKYVFIRCYSDYMQKLHLYFEFFRCWCCMYCVNRYLVSEGCIKPLCDLLLCPDPRIVTVCLEGLENILKVGETDKNLGASGEGNVYAQMIDEAEGLEKIENLQSHDNNEIYEKAVKILEAYWMEEEDDAMGATMEAPQGVAFDFGQGGNPDLNLGWIQVGSLNI